MDFLDPTDLDPALAEVLDDAYASSVGVETAARHLWVIHSEARKVAEESVVAEATAALLDESDEPQLALRSLAGRVPRAAVPLLALMMMMSSSGVAVAASQNSLPGELLYGVKRTTERAQLVMARNPAARAELQLEFALTRLAEIEAVADTRPEVVPDLVTDINVSLTDVQHAPPEIAAQVAPQRESIRQQTSAQIAELQLPPEIGIAVGVAMTAVPQDELFTTTAVPTPAPSGGATAAASGDADEAADSATTGPNEQGDGTEATAVAGEPTPVDDDFAVDPDAAAVLGDAADDRGSDDEPATDDGFAGSDAASPGEQSNGSSAPNTGPSGQSSSPPSPSASPSASASPEQDEGEVIEEDTSTSDGPAITSRPHPSDQAGADRGGEDEHAPPTSEPTGEPTGEEDAEDGTAADGPPVAEEPSPPADQPQDDAAADDVDAVEESTAPPATHYHRPGS